ncbi:MAG: hypothetical protein IKS98_08390 [Lachnospiraceae bacterium]|nr:hypothetical protein [Lachnospiraceae bacterium]
MKYAGIVSLVIAAIVLLVGVITPVSIVKCAVVAVLLVGFGLFAIRKDRKNHNEY